MPAFNPTPTDKQIFRNLLKETMTCMKSKGPEITFEEQVACETAYLSTENSFTYHTHPNGNPNPSEEDRMTTKKLGKKYMIIGLVPQKVAVIYDTEDNFSKMIGKIPL